MLGDYLSEVVAISYFYRISVSKVLPAHGIVSLDVFTCMRSQRWVLHRLSYKPVRNAYMKRLIFIACKAFFVPDVGVTLCKLMGAVQE